MNRINVTRASLPSFDEYVAEISDIWDSHWLTNMGSKHEMLATKLIDYLQGECISLFTNGHMALELALQAMQLQGEVITTPFTFASTTHAIVRNGLKPVFCDIEGDFYTIDVKKLERLITKDTVAIVPVHVYGNVCDVESIQNIANKYGLKVIYDAAHAFGVKYKGRGICQFGDASMLSFHATKVFNTIEGGAVCYSDKEYGLTLNRLKNFGIKNEEEVDYVGSNAKMNEFQAAMGLCNLRHIDEWIQMRREVCNRYRANLEGISGIRISPVQENVESNYAYFPVVFDDKVFGATRDDVCEHLKAYSIFARKYFYPITNEFTCYNDSEYMGETPIASSISKKVLTLPLYPDLSLHEVDKICDAIFETPRGV